ncbi:dihydroorotate dehydrogenase (fumarate) [Balneicella halophila]|uniref:Dihydroorotate dehydrogenase (Fumarate) n=1 Tax=Balneicella halophila TaxID=1537566 RepID=A0A7L4UQR7_BALHA|nr:dihydroorotate dehydrogenase-like protein [Balneicella halophila]PVX52093.1 dihydroorotate dehydrogenase (fumarate) [Balneicella halophila]
MSMIRLETTFAGLQLKTPIIVGSSGLTDSVSKIKQLAANGAGAVVLKSLFEEQILEDIRETHSQNSMDAPELDEYVRNYTKQNSIAKYLKLIKDAKAAVDIPVIASINCIDANEWTNFANQIEDAGADALELNIALLASDMQRTSEEIEQNYFKIIDAVSKTVELPLIIKLGQYSASLANLIQRIAWTEKVAGLVLFNRFYSPDFDIETGKPLSTNVLSTPDEFGTSLRWVTIMAPQVEVPIVASTGIHDSAAVIKQLWVGAQAVQMVSALYKKGPDYLTEVLDGLKDWMKRHNFESVDQFRGKLHYTKSYDATVFERLQFLKYFSDNKNI